MPAPQTSVKPASDGRDTHGVGASSAAEASSAHSRINIPLNLDHYRHLAPSVQENVLWFHQHALDNRMTRDDCTSALGYDWTVIFRVLKGTYVGSWDNVCEAIASYRKLASARAGIQKAGFVRNSISDLIWSALDYAMATNSITLIEGESGQGKTIACEAWRDANNHGRSVMVEMPPIGGNRMVLRTLADAVGVNKSQSQEQILEGLVRAFNANRMLIIDEARRLLPVETRGDVNPVRLEIVRYIHDMTHCGVALIATQRFGDNIRKLQYQYEQVLGRIAQPVRLFRTIDDAGFLPIVRQFFPAPSQRLQGAIRALVNEELGGRLRSLGWLLANASRIASKSRQALAEEHFYKAVALRTQMSGETQHAAKKGGTA